MNDGTMNIEPPLIGINQIYSDVSFNTEIKQDNLSIVFGPLLIKYFDTNQTKVTSTTVNNDKITLTFSKELKTKNVSNYSSNDFKVSFDKNNLSITDLDVSGVELVLTVGTTLSGTPGLEVSYFKNQNTDIQLIDVNDIILNDFYYSGGVSAATAGISQSELTSKVDTVTVPTVEEGQDIVLDLTGASVATSSGTDSDEKKRNRTSTFVNSIMEKVGASGGNGKVVLDANSLAFPTAVSGAIKDKVRLFKPDQVIDAESFTSDETFYIPMKLGEETKITLDGVLYTFTQGETNVTVDPPFGPSGETVLPPNYIINDGDYTIAIGSASTTKNDNTPPTLIKNIDIKESLTGNDGNEYLMIDIHFNEPLDQSILNFGDFNTNFNDGQYKFGVIKINTNIDDNGTEKQPINQLYGMNYSYDSINYILTIIAKDGSGEGAYMYNSDGDKYYVNNSSTTNKKEILNIADDLESLELVELNNIQDVHDKLYQQN